MEQAADHPPLRSGRPPLSRTRDHRDTLLFAFERGLAQQPAVGERWAFLNAAPLSAGHDVPLETLVCVQGFRPAYLALAKAGYAVEPHLAEGPFDGAIILAGRSRAANEINLSRAVTSTHPGGQVVVAGEKTSGIASLRKWVAGLGHDCESISKHHAQCFVFRPDRRALPSAATSIEIDGYTIPTTGFSADGPDAGSRLLADHFDARIAGDVADFGAGWGYLSARLLKEAPDITSISLYEADHASLEAAKTNLPDSRAQFHWQDLASEPVDRQLDCIIMNPPFHTGRAADPTLGISFITRAAESLRPGGRLLMVANAGLPYEATLNHHFRRAEELHRASGFKVIEAIKSR